MSDVGQKMLAVVCEIDAALTKDAASQEADGRVSAHGVDVSLLTLLASEPFGPHLVLERLITDAYQD